MSKLDNDKLSNITGGKDASIRDTSKFFSLGSNELNMLSKEGYIDENGCIFKSNLESAQEFLRKSGWNGVLFVKGRDFDTLPEIINLSNLSK